MTTPTQQLTDVFQRVMSTTHRAVFDLTNGRVLGRVAGMQAARITVTGRRSGQPRTVMLTVPTRAEDGSIVLVASKGGDDRDPAWYLNLVANPEVEVVTGGESYQAIARVATPEEKAELWPAVTDAYRGYAGYQRRTDREIPLVICERRD